MPVQAPHNVLCVGRAAWGSVLVTHSLTWAWGTLLAWGGGMGPES